MCCELLLLVGLASCVTEKMCCQVLLLVGLASCVTGASGSDHGTRSYRAQEGGSVTFEWLFSPPAVVSAVKIHCLALAPPKVFFHLDRRADEAPHQQFAGRVRCDRDALGTGRVRLRLSGVRAADSGLYLCRMATGSGRKATQFSLQVTALNDSDPGTPEPAPTPAPEPKPAPEPEPAAPVTTSRPVALGRGRVGLYAAMGLAAVTGIFYVIYYYFNRNTSVNI